MSPKKDVHGVEVLYDVNARGVEPDEFFTKVEEALRLVADHQPWRLIQVQRYIQLIIIRRRASNRAALVTENTIEIDWTFVQRHSAAEVAASVLHEMVHARVIRCLGWDAGGRRPREEELCRQMELWFGEAIPNGEVVRQRASAAIAGGGSDLAPEVDWKEMAQINADAYWGELALPKWFERLVRRRR